MAERKFDDCIESLNQTSALTPQNFPVNAMLAEANLRSGDPDEAILRLRKLLKSNNEAPSLWNMLAESYGKKGDRLGVYQSQAEYYFEHGLVDRAIEQLRFAIPLAEKNFETSARLHNRIREMEYSRQDMAL